MKNFKITVIPFLLGAWVCTFLIGGNYEFLISAAIVLLMLRITGQVDLI